MKSWRCSRRYVIEIAQLFAHQEELSPLEIVYWDRLTELIGDIADYVENAGDQLRLLIAR